MVHVLISCCAGGGFGTRTHCANEEETVFEQMRPIIVNGLDAIATRQDLLDRSIVLRLPTISRRFTEKNCGIDSPHSRRWCLVLLPMLLRSASRACRMWRCPTSHAWRTSGGG